MKNRNKLSGIIAINLALMAILCVVSWAPTLQADSAGASSMDGGDYLMVGGEVNGMTSNGIYVLEQRSGLLLGLKYELGTRKLKGMNLRNIHQDAKRTGPSR